MRKDLKLTRYFVLLLIIAYFFKIIFNTQNFETKSDVRIYISKNHSLYKQISPYLKNKISFLLAYKILTFRSKPKEGSYIVNSFMTNKKFIKNLTRGIQSPVRLILHNIISKKDLIDKICFYTNIDRKQLTGLFKDEVYIKSLGFNIDNFMVLFIPNTYKVYWNISAKNLIKKIFNEYSKFWNKDRLQKVALIKLNPIQVSILASIVQAETLDYDEAKIIARIYRNRLKKKLRLMADPTLKNSNDNKVTNRVLKCDTKTDSFYNTYRNYGLPPGPIRLPEIKYIDAVLNMDKNDYLFLCAKDDFSGKHYFSKSFSEHLKYARRYWKALNKRKIFR